MINYIIPFTNVNPIESTKEQLSFEQLVKIFMNNKDLKPASIKAYFSSFNQFTTYLKDRSISLVTEQNIKEFKDYLLNKKLSVFTVISHLSALKSLFSFMAIRNLYPDIAKEIKIPKKPKGFMRDALTKNQAKLLIKSTIGNDIISKRNFALISILLRCGLRSIEIIRANIEDVRQNNGIPILQVHGKGRDCKDEFVVLTEEALSALNNYISKRKKYNPEEPLFASHGPRNKKGRLTTRSIRRIVKSHLKTIGISSNRITCHSLRHTFATLALANNAPLLAVQHAMRHANINTTTIYTHTADRLTNGAERYVDINLE